MFDKDQAAYNRANRTQKPDFAPGMGSSDPFGGGGMNSDPFASSGSSDPFGSSGGSDPFGGGGSSDPFGSSGGSDPFGGGGGSDPFGGGGSPDPFGASNNSFGGGASPFGGSPDPFGGGGMMGSFAGSGFGMQPTAVEQPKAPEDKFFDALKSIGKTIGGVILDVIKSFSKNDVVFWNKYALRVAIFGAVIAGLNLLACIFGFPGLFPIIAGLLTAGLGVMCFMFTYESASGYTPPQPVIEEPQPSFDTSSSDFAFDTGMDDESYYDDDEGYEDPAPVEEEDTSWMKASDSIDYDNIMARVPDVPAGMYTRQFLFEQFVQLLPCYTPDYTKTTQYDESSEQFLKFDDLIARASKILGLKEEEYPVLQQCEENKFGFRLIMTRPSKKVKPDDIASEIAKGWAATIYDNEEDWSKVFFKTSTIMEQVSISLFSGMQYKLSVHDMYMKEKDFMLDTKNAIPVAIGVSDTGKAYMLDMSKVQSIIMAGMPRSGKTWSVKAMLLQMLSLNSPRRVQVAFIDPKDTSGDWARFVTPHVKYFASKYRDASGEWVNPDCDSILDLLNWVCKVEGPRRKKLLGDAGVPNANDYRKRNPDKDLPALYIVVDEMTSLGTMYKEDLEIYKNALNVIVTQFPNLDIHGLFIPHEVKDQIIPKTAYDSIKVRFDVKGNAQHLEQTMGVLGRNFKYNLVNEGDMAMYVDRISSAVLFCKSAIICDENVDLDRTCEIVGKLWARWEPDSVDDSIMGENRVHIGKTSVKLSEEDKAIEDKFSPKKNAQNKPASRTLSTKPADTLENKATKAIDDYMEGFKNMF